MDQGPESKKHRVLIVSSHSLFGQGIKRLLQVRKEADVIVVGIVSTVAMAMEAIADLSPDLVVVDYDDEAVNRDEFLSRFMEGDTQLRVVLLSLKEGGSEALIYDRRTMAASQIDDWLSEWTSVEKTTSEAIIPEADQRGQRNHRSYSMKHAIGAFLFIVVLTVVGLFIFNPSLFLPEAASAQAQPIDSLLKLEFKIIAFLFALIIGLMVYSVVFFRRKKGDTEDAVHVTGNNTIELIWGIIPLGTVIFLAMLGSNTLAQTQKAEPKPLEVEVTGQQWSWRFEYPEFNLITTELTLPVDRQVLFKLSAVDVIHSFYVPEFRVKQDLVPGAVKELLVTPTETGEFNLICAEMCGTSHAYMTSPISVVPQEEFDGWVTEQLKSVSEDPVVRGQVWMTQYGCVACHSVDGTPKVGPSFFGLFGREETFEDGSTLIADEAYIFESIRQPALKIVQGFPNAMPAEVAKDISDEQIADMIEYIKTLK